MQMEVVLEQGKWQKGGELPHPHTWNRDRHTHTHGIGTATPTYPAQINLFKVVETMPMWVWQSLFPVTVLCVGMAIHLPMPCEVQFP